MHTQHNTNPIPAPTQFVIYGNETSKKVADLCKEIAAFLLPFFPGAEINDGFSLCDGKGPNTIFTVIWRNSQSMSTEIRLDMYRLIQQQVPPEFIVKVLNLLQEIKRC